MQVSRQTQAVMLLTARFPKEDKTLPKPLTAAEWGRFALWLKDRGLTPEALLTGRPAELLAAWSDVQISLERIVFLLGRAAALGLALEKWQRAGLWVLTRSDSAYPSRLKRRLKFDAPPLLFGAGDPALLECGGVAVVGSRDARAQDLELTRQLGSIAANQGLGLVSGGARGVDETAMLSALAAGGACLGILSDSLLRAATSARYRDGLMQGRLVLVSPFNPEAGFDVGNAMARNRYIYCLADAAVVVTSSRESGGTWHGALENLKQAWVPLWVQPDPNPDAGTNALLPRGARPLPPLPFNLQQLTDPLACNPIQAEVAASAMEDLFQTTAASEPAPAPNPTPKVATATSTVSLPEAAATTYSVPDFFTLFLNHLAQRKGGGTPEELSLELALHKSQVTEWLKHGVAEKKIEKYGRPVRYRLCKASPDNGTGQAPLPL